jgi:putative sterol carrier protein
VSAPRHRPFTAAWAEAFHAAIETDDAYRSAAAKWTWPVALVLSPAPEFGYPDAVAVELQLDRGRCHGTQILPAEAAAAPFVLTAPYAVWKAVVRGELDPIVGVTRGKIAVRGSLATLMMQARAAAALVACAKAVPTAFPDEE